MKEKDIYYFINDSPHFKSNEPHYYICIKRTDGSLFILVCCTTQFEKRKAYIETRNLPYSTLVHIPPDKDNKLKQTSYVDCNSCELITLEKFREMHLKGELDYKGELSEVKYEEILIGLHDSPLIENENKDLLPHKPQ